MPSMLKGQILLAKNSGSNASNNPSYSLQKAELYFEEDIKSIQTTDNSSNDFDELIILPGFIDTHVHGGFDSDTMDGPEAVQNLASFHLNHGTTTIYPTTITNPWETILLALQAVKDVSQLQLFNEKEQTHSLPSIPGAHLEGPFISPNRLGAQPAFAITPTTELVQTLLDLDVIKLLTIAPEIPDALEAALAFASKQCRISIGHTTATYDDILPFVNEVHKQGGTIGYTHLFNAMGGMAGRKPNTVGASLADSQSYAEIILDTHHVHVASFLAAFNAKPNNLSLITDAMRACGMGNGKSELGGQEVYIQDGMAKMADGTLAGSLLTMDIAFKNAMKAGLSIEEASRLASTTPANYMGLTDRGTLDVGKRADIIVMNKAFDILEVYVKGKRLYG